MNKVEFCLKLVLLVRPGTYWVMCYIIIFYLLTNSTALKPSNQKYEDVALQK